MERVLEEVIDKLRELELKTEIEDRIRHKKRYVSKTSAIRDVIKLLEEIKQS